MPKLTHAEIDRQVEEAMASPNTLSMEHFQQFIDKRGQQPPTTGGIPLPPQQAAKKLPL